MASQHHTPTVDPLHPREQDRPRRRTPVAVLFAAALAGSRDAEDALRAAALINDRAADALWALALAGAEAELRDPAGEPARTAFVDQALAFLRPYLAAARADHLAATHPEADPA